MLLVNESLVCYRSNINKADLKLKTKQKVEQSRRTGEHVCRKPKYFKDGCLDLALHVSSTEGAQRDAEGLPYGVQVVHHHLRLRVADERGTSNNLNREL